MVDQVIATNGSTPLRKGEEEKEVFDLLEEDEKRSLRLQRESQTSSYSSSNSHEAQRWRERIDMAELLKSCGVRFYASLSKQYPPALIKAKVQEWLLEPDLGPGMLVKMIQGGAPIIGAVKPVERPAPSQQAEPGPDDQSWHQRRYEAGRQGKTTDDYYQASDGRWLLRPDRTKDSGKW